MGHDAEILTAEGLHPHAWTHGQLLEGAVGSEDGAETSGKCRGTCINPPERAAT